MARKLPPPEFDDCGVETQSSWAARESIRKDNELIAFADQIRRETIEECAGVAFEKIRCDDRTDRWQVANEVAAHIRAIADRSKP